ncbi:hypothetical protein P175DRAFT_062495 [Aspergillus ochraceoroseus IBT 24754]|uniref:MYB DNA-binding domain protein n=3 Tax=Aspergillus subgen. Nidulantes TaxID=2720870 RepID=A0A0F8UW07_9EURO|nr:uncharacterized protein P175DRAFT_062495 [Aspergillus ochraceoroseus IBT 24754]KKK15741.1 hypothetical protein AOCH_004302 [Aspergillus ochraceoroseus]KKK23658.1 hypothetical protein ARAM_006144 [Aspergillus rambellii]PTU25092.1 hypothetical protein P175DRAFT_062495 [Aspergillus ochraceoroseus IBT 24754]
MSATLADPYRDYAIDYSQHASCKPEEHEGTLVYHSQQPHIQHPKHTDTPFAQGNSHGTAFEQHHANATVLPAATPQPPVHDISQTVVLNQTQMLPRQLPVQYPTANFDLSSSVQRGKKRPHSETEPEGGNTDHGIRQLPVLPPDATSEPTHSPEILFGVHGEPSQHHPMQSHSFGPADSMALPQHHHHHHLPPHASLRATERHGMNVESSPLPSGPPSVVGQPGMPDPAPRPRGPKLKFTPEEDALLVELKENKNLTWKQIADFFPGRTSGTLQVRYCTKLKAKDVAWSDEMVQRLQRAMQEYENDRWRIIAGKVGNGFTPAACREKATQL